jgi:hypothetical protein
MTPGYRLYVAGAAGGAGLPGAGHSISDCSAGMAVRMLAGPSTGSTADGVGAGVTGASVGRAINSMPPGVTVGRSEGNAVTPTGGLIASQPVTIRAQINSNSRKDFRVGFMQGSIARPRTASQQKRRDQANSNSPGCIEFRRLLRRGKQERQRITTHARRDQQMVATFGQIHVRHRQNDIERIVERCDLEAARPGDNIQ